MLKFLRKPKIIVTLIIIVLIIIISVSFFGKEKAPVYDLITAEKGELIQEVSVTGTVKPSESVDLAFEASGRVKEIKADIGDKVEVDQELIVLNNADLKAQLSKAWANVSSARAQLDQAQANLAAEEAKLQEYIQGTRSEEIKIAETKVYNKQQSLADALDNLKNVEEKAEADLDEDYGSALTAMQSAVTSAKTALLTFTDIQLAHFNSNNQDDVSLAFVKSIAVEKLLGKIDAGRWSRYSLSTLYGGVFGQVNDLVGSSNQVEIDSALVDTLDALQKVKNALDSVPLVTELSSTEQTNLSTEKTNVNTEITTVSSRKQAIAVQKATNESNISTASSSVNDAQSALDSAEDELALERAGYTAEQILAQEASVKQAEANVSSKRALVNQASADVENYQAQINKTILLSPIQGVITKQEAKVGEIIGANTIMVSIISEKMFEIETPVAEVDIANVKINDTAKLTLDAYGSDIEYSATVYKIDPAETIVEGVPTYKVYLQFVDEDGTIKSGMTANIDILTAKKDNVISLPQRAVLRQNGSKIVRVLNEDGKSYTEKTVQTGIRGSDGNIEIVSGIEEGEKIILSIVE